MKRPLFSASLYREMMRQLRVAGITMLVLFTVFDAFLMLMEHDWYPYYHADNGPVTAFHPTLSAIPYMAPAVLTLLVFAFQNSRRDSDFYHSLPFTKVGLSFTALAAVVTWCSIITFGSSLITGAIACFHNFGDASLYDYTVLPTKEAVSEYLLPTIGNMLLVMLAAFAACLFMTALTFLSTQLSGNALSAVLTTLILLIAPYAILYTLSSTVLNTVQIVPDGAFLLLFDLPSQVLLFHLNGGDTVWPWVVTLLLTAVLFWLGLWCAERRASETAGKAGSTNAVQITLRSLLGFACCLPAIITLHNNSGYLFDAVIVLIYLGVAVVYFLFELFTTKHARNLIKAIPWFVGLLAFNAVTIFGMWAYEHAVWSYTPDADEIDSVTVIECYRFADGGSDWCGVAMNDEACLEIVSEALDNAAEHASVNYCRGCDDVCHNADTYVTLDVKIRSGVFTHTRTVRVSRNEAKVLLAAAEQVLEARV